MTRILLFLAGLAAVAVAPRLPAAAGASLLWVAWIAVPGLLWSGGASALRSPRAWLLPGLLQLLLLSGLWGLLGLPARVLPWALAGSALLPLLVFRRPPTREHEPALPGRLLLLLCILLGAWMAWRPAPVALNSDAPAHLAAIREAMAQDSLRPSDSSAGAVDSARDPRFGVLHGLDAALALHGDWNAEEVLRAAPIVFAPLWLIAHANFFALFLSGRWLPLLIALLFSLSGADGRLYGLWNVAYPGSVAIACATFALAEAWRQRDGARWPRPAEWLLAATVFVHPFAWWGSCVLLLHAALWRVLQTRSLRRASVALALRCLALGLLGSLPILLTRAHSVDGPHAQPIDVLLLGESGLYFCDPFRVMRWAGALAPWLLPILLLGATPLLKQPRGALLIAAPLSLWTVAFNPLVQPWLYPLVGYLSERLGRLAYPELIACVLIARPWSERYLPRRRGGRSWRFAAALFGVFLLWRSLGWGGLVLRADPRSFASPSIHALDEIASALEPWPHRRLLADPRSSYALSALRGGRFAVGPVAHASPNDRGIETRLAHYRRLLDPFADRAAIEESLDALDSDLLLVHEGIEAWSPSEEFGFVADDVRQRRLRERLVAAGNVPVLAEESWAIFELSELKPGRPALASDCMLLQEPEPIAVGERFELVAVQPRQRRIAADEILEIELVYRVREGSGREQSPTLDRVHLRLEGEMPTLARPLQPIGKPIRKLFVERSGASERRFGMAFVPFGGYREPESWSTDYACERVSLRIPERIRAGDYAIQATIQKSSWRPRLQLRDYLSDRDRFSAESVAYVEIVDSSTSSGSSEDEPR